MTNEEINALSNEQINVFMARCIYGAEDHEYVAKNESVKTPYGVSVSDGALYKICDGISFISVKDYCGDASLMMKIAAESKVGLIFSDIDVTAFICSFSWDGPDGRHEFDSDFEHSDKPEEYLRAIGIVYLKSKGVL
ncbi:hypothetical protein OQ486_09260 [Plesiomonas shigelloides]|uniref:hypothetical protein n=1 Tax=Plesiomonas shigelloides TaxID=703 RepID=UPI002247F1CE|nr:hypothetical protein [Plesiomonas shigelloides]MCX2533663.1 hypothetical protein [Plesiomonas shigelloides]